MKAFITGGTGFIGSRVVQRLAALGYDVVCLVRSEIGERRAIEAGARAAWGDILDPACLPEPMAGADLVIHIAGLYRLGEADTGQFEAINVKGTKHVLEAAVSQQIPRIVYISSVAIYGDTHGKLAAEDYRMPIGQAFISAYDRSKWLADVQVVQPMVKRGAPIITVIPSAVFGPGDTSLVGQLFRYFVQGWLVLFPGPETCISLTYIEDAVDGILLAAKHGRIGERYNLSGGEMTLGQVSRIWARLSKWPAPRAYVPARLIHKLEGLSRLLRGLVARWPEILSPGAIRVLGVSYTNGADKARRELGWQPRSLEEGMLATLKWLQAQPGMPASPAEARRRQAAGLLLLAALAAAPFALWEAVQNLKKPAAGARR